MEDERSNSRRDIRAAKMDLLFVSRQSMVEEPILLISEGAFPQHRETIRDLSLLCVIIRLMDDTIESRE